MAYDGWNTRCTHLAKESSKRNKSYVNPAMFQGTFRLMIPVQILKAIKTTKKGFFILKMGKVKEIL